MPRAFLKLNSQVPDCYGQEGEYTWYHSGILPLINRYQQAPSFQVRVGTATISDADLGKTFYSWKKDWRTFVNYYCTDSDVYELNVGSRGTFSGASAFGPKFAAFGPTLYLTNGVDAIKKCTGTTFSGIGVYTDTGDEDSPQDSAAIRPKFLIAFKNQLIAANITLDTNYGSGTEDAIVAGEYKHLVWWSSPDNPEAFGSQLVTPNFVGTGFQPIFDGSIEITGLAEGEDAFFVFKEHGIYRFDGPPLGGYSTISTSLGCISPNTIQRIKDKIFFMSQAGLTSIDVRTNEIIEHSSGINRAVMASYTYEVDDNLYFTPPGIEGDEGDVLYLSFLPGANLSRESSAQDPDNGLYFLYYRAKGSTDEPLLMIYSIERGEFGYIHLPVQFQTIGYVPHSSTDGFPMGNLRGVVKSSSTHTLYDVDSDTNVDDRTIYIRWPFQFSFPDRRVSIRNVRPVFSDAVGEARASDYSVTVNILSTLSPATNWLTAAVTNAEDMGEDFNITVNDCPFAEAHSIGIEIVPSGGGQMFNIMGVEVEYEEDLLKAV